MYANERPGGRSRQTRRQQDAKVDELTEERGRERPIGLPAPRQRRRRATLDRDLIVAAAVRLVDREGADALSMRRLGMELASGATSVYRHVRDKEELIGLAFDAITGELALPEPATPWDDALVASARGLRDLFHRHRNFVPLIGRRSALGPSTLAIVERLLGILRGAGFGDQSAYHAISAIGNYATGFTILELVPRLRGAGGAGVPEYRRLLDLYLRGLPADAFPNALAVAPAMVGREDQDFEFGLEALVRGLRSLGVDQHGGEGRPG